MKIKFLFYLVLTSLFVSSSSANDEINEVSFYTGTFDVIDKEGDDQTTLIGVEHKNPDLFRNTFLGKFKPITASFSPGYYEKGDGKDLGSVLEFKSEIKLGFDFFENSKLSYSYSHISNNNWGKTNPGTDNQQITFSKNF